MSFAASPRRHVTHQFLARALEVAWRLGRRDGCNGGRPGHGPPAPVRIRPASCCRSPEADVGLVGQLALLVMFNALYVLPVCGILLLRLLTGERSAALLARASGLIERFAPFVLVGLALALGVGLVVRGASGLSR
jgi:hypothetical protein